MTRLAQVLEVGVERELIARNPAKGKRRRLQQRKPERTFFDRAEQIVALLHAAGELDGEARIDRRATPRRALQVVDAKTDAGVRQVDLLPALREELSVHKARTRFDRPDDFVFPTESGAESERNNVRRRVLGGRSSGRTRTSPPKAATRSPMA